MPEWAKWEYAHVSHRRKQEANEPCITNFPAVTAPMPESAGLYLDSFLAAAGKRGWELAGTLIPFAKGKTLSVGGNDEDDRSTYLVEDALNRDGDIMRTPILGTASPTLLRRREMSACCSLAMISSTQMCSRLSSSSSLILRVRGVEMPGRKLARGWRRSGRRLRRGLPPC